jgi:hypothetical protein
MVARRSSPRKSSTRFSWTTYNLLVATVLVANALAVILNGLSLAAYQSLLTDAIVPISNSLAVGLAFGLFAFLWGLIVISLVTRMRSLRTLSILLGLTSLVSLIAALAAGWFAPDPSVLATYPVIGAYKGATVALYSVQIVLYFVLALKVSMYA